MNQTELRALQAEASQTRQANLDKMLASQTRQANLEVKDRQAKGLLTKAEAKTELLRIKAKGLYRIYYRSRFGNAEECGARWALDSNIHDPYTLSKLYNQANREYWIAKESNQK